MTQLQDIVESFELLDDWDQRYQYIVELGESLPDMPVLLKTDENKVKGCMSQVWVSPYRDESNPNLIHYHADCDTSIIKGVLAILVQLVDGKTAESIDQLDIDKIFTGLKLDEHLSPNRHVGVYGIVEQMKRQVRELERPPHQNTTANHTMSLG